jgi:hypothetical protein
MAGRFLLKELSFVISVIVMSVELFGSAFGWDQQIGKYKFCGLNQLDYLHLGDCPGKALLPDVGASLEYPSNPKK